ncbi:hypothetical protein FGL91_10715 [Microbacterium sp. CBA3102]|uniref:hypothetical protein n=1 Tax=Microbacterium sp. CBA3102 TaxID=2603598 RepID=UPI0011BB922E|nr:hypothetical protein [Microbacterium sp. CBA3102]QEA28988.1 hypothetical protein FGL91_10715 [Microbacterium sp. CBA3102]
MTTKFKNGDIVFVPARVLPNPDREPFALKDVTVTGQVKRKIQIDRQDGHGNDIIVASRLVHGPNLGITVLEIGDLSTEDHTLDPLAKSVLHYLRLLVRPENIRLLKIRTVSELQHLWSKYEPATSHVVFIGHGSEDSIRFLDRSDPVTGSELAKLMLDAAPSTDAKLFLSLSCLTGRAPFAKPFSKSPVCRDYIAPFQSVHSAAASLYSQSFFAHHLLSGEEVRPAHAKARSAVGAGVSFRRWRNGAMIAN